MVFLQLFGYELIHSFIHSFTQLNFLKVQRRKVAIAKEIIKRSLHFDLLFIVFNFNIKMISCISGYH